MLIFSLLFLSKFTCRTLVLIPYHLLSQRVQTRGLKGKLLVRSLMMKSSITELWLKFWLERILKSCVTILLRIKVLIQKWMFFKTEEKYGCTEIWSIIYQKRKDKKPKNKEQLYLATTIGRSKSRPFSTGKREGQEFQRLQRGLHVLQRNSGPK